MSTNSNKLLVRRYFEECVSGATRPNAEAAVALADELLAEEFVMAFNADSDFEAARGREEHKQFIRGHARTFPDDTWTIEGLLAAGDQVACRWRFRGTHANSGSSIDVRAADFFTIRDGRLAELRRFLDFEELHRQMGATPTRK